MDTWIYKKKTLSTLQEKLLLCLLQAGLDLKSVRFDLQQTLTGTGKS